MAKTAFVSILVTLLILLLLIAFGDEHTALNLNAASGSIAAILSFLTLLVLGYMGITHHQDLKDKDSRE